jgi:hypothetical protein
MENIIGRYVIFISYRSKFPGRALGKIISWARPCSNKEIIIRIKRIDNCEDIVTYSRSINEENVTILDSKDEFLARLEF